LAEAVYILCALTSLGCALLLTRSYLATRTRLLLWSSLCFAMLAVNNMILFVDLVVVPGADLALLRSTTALSAIGLLLYGLIWESR